MGANRIRSDYVRPAPKVTRKRPQVELPLVLSAAGNVGYSSEMDGDGGSDTSPAVIFVSPKSFTGLLRWYKADSFLGIANDGDSVGGGISTRGAWKDQSGNFVDGGATVATQAGPSDVVNISGGTFTFAASDVKKAIRYTAGSGGIDVVIRAFINPTQVQVDITQVIAGSTFRIYDDANFVSFVQTGPIYKTAIIGAMPIIRLTDAQRPSLSLASFDLNDFTIVAVGMMTATPPGGAASCYIVSEPGTSQHLQRKHSNFEKNTMGFLGLGLNLISCNPIEMTDPPAPGDCMSTAYRRTGINHVFRQNQANLTTQGGTDGSLFTISQIGESILGNNMDLGELMIWNRALSDGEVSRLYAGYLKNRWVTLP